MCKTGGDPFSASNANLCKYFMLRHCTLLFKSLSA
jgi:hypothetical protein